jgi:formate dehydrogenase subunit gamma
MSRTSAIFVHDFLAWAIVFVLAGRIRKAHEDPETAPGMRTGFVSRGWAERHHPRWLDDLDEEGGGPGRAPRSHRRPPTRPRA